MRRLCLVLALGSCCGLVALATVANAHFKRYSVRVSQVERELIPGGGALYSGSLSSANPDCVSHRSIAVVVLRSERVRTDDSGQWQLQSEFSGPLEVVVGVRKKLLPRDGEPAKQFCKKGHSSTTFTDGG